MDEQCSISDCSKPEVARGWCRMHYSRWSRTGSTDLAQKARRSYGKCLAPGCDKTEHCKGYCGQHYSNLQRHGGLEAPDRKTPAELRFEPKVKQTDSCWLWTGGTYPNGYAKFFFNGKNDLAHRVAYQLWVGPIDAGKHIDHLCHNIICVNPDHLRPVTPKQNVEHQRGANKNSKSGIRGVSWNKAQKCWVSSVYHNGKFVHWGYHKTIEQAEAAVIEARNQYFTHNDKDRQE